MPPTSAGLIQTGLGDREAALAARDQGFAVRDVRMTIVRYDGRWKRLRDDPRFAAVLRQMNLTA